MFHHKNSVNVEMAMIESRQSHLNVDMVTSMSSVLFFYNASEATKLSELLRKCVKNSVLVVELHDNINSRTNPW